MVTLNKPVQGNTNWYQNVTDNWTTIENAITSSVGGPNLSLNGGFAFAQRQTPGSATTYSNTSGRSYSADRWGITNENASVQYIRTDTIASAETGLAGRYYGKFSKITNTGKVIVSQVVEAADLGPVRGKTVTLRLKLKTANSITVRVGLLQLTSSGTADTIPATFVSAFGSNGTDPTWGTNLSAITPSTAGDSATISGNFLSCSCTSSWATFSGTFSVPSSSKNLVLVVFGNNQLGTTDTISLADVDLYEGSTTREWAPRPYQQELDLCQRFYVKSFAVDTAPAQNIGTGTSELRIRFQGTLASSVSFGIDYRFPVVMRVAPTGTTYNPSAASAEARNETAGVNGTSTAVACTTTTAWVTFTIGSSPSRGDVMGVHASFDAEL